MARARKELITVSWLGHAEARERLALSQKQGRAAHAYLISGPEGIGKSAVALEYARLLLCDQPGDKPCGACPQCTALATLHHPDLHIIAPSGTPKDSDTPASETYPKELSLLRQRLSGDPYAPADLADLAASDSKSARRKLATGSKIRVADARELLHMAYRKPYQARQSVFVILNADKMLREAQNALLKVLEEPPTSATIILTASQLELVLPTVRSRCQAVKLYAYSSVELRAALAGAGIETHAAELAAALAGGSVRRALSFAQMDAAVLERTAVEFLATAAVLAPDKVQEQVAKLLDDTAFLDEAFFELMALFLADAAARANGAGAHQLNFPSQRERIGKLTAAYPQADYVKAMSAVDRASTSRTAGFSPALVLTALAIELHRALGMRARA